jgi:hypothetical protein
MKLRFTRQIYDINIIQDIHFFFYLSSNLDNAIILLLYSFYLRDFKSPSNL